MKNPAKDRNPLQENCESWPESTAMECKSVSIKHTTKLVIRIMDFLVNALVLQITISIALYNLFRFCPNMKWQVLIKRETTKKSNLKSTIKPYASKSMPKKGHPMRTRKKPAPNEMVPCSLHLLII